MSSGQQVLSALSGLPSVPTLNAGTPAVFSADSLYMSIDMLTESKAILVYYTTGYNLYAVILDVSGSTITAGTALDLGSTWQGAHVTKLTSTTALLVNATSASAQAVRVLSVSGSTITAGTPDTFLGTSYNSWSARLTDTTALSVLIYSDETYAQLFTVTGTSVACSSETLLYNAHPNVTAGMVGLSDTQAIMFYGTNAIPLTVSGATITKGTGVAVGGTALDSSMMSSSQGVLTYGTWKVKTFTVSGGTISVLNTAVDVTATTLPSVRGLTSSLALVAYPDSANSNYGTARFAVPLSGTTIAGEPIVFESAGVSVVKAARLSDSKAIVVYRDAGNSNAGTACVLYT